MNEVDGLPADEPAAAAPASSERHGRGIGILVLSILAVAIIVVLVPALSPGGVRPLPPAPAGATAPEFSLRPLGGTTPMRLSAYRGRPVVVNFWASWCAPCQEEAPALAAAERRWRERGVVFLGINVQDTAAGAREFIRTNTIAYPTLVDADRDVALSYGVTGFPETFFIDANGTIQAKDIAALDTATLDQRLATITHP